MKEQTLIEMRNKIETLGGVANQLIKEVNNIKHLALGTLETIKQMPDYDEAINKLKAQAAEQSGETEKVKSLEKISD
jgi:cell shape-determining protein MreC